MSDFVAYTELYGSETKTLLTDENSVVWCSGDRLSIFQGANIADTYEVSESSVGKSEGSFSLVSDNSGEVNGDFTSGVEISANIAVYPFDDDLDCSSVNVSEDQEGVLSYTISNVSIPSTQSYTENSFASGSFPMVAVTSSMGDHTLKFKNLLGAIELNLRGTCIVKSIAISGNKGEILAGEAEVVAYVGDAKPEITMLQEGSESVILDCGDGVGLNQAEATRFIIAIPPTDFVTGFTVTITDDEENEMVLENMAPNQVLRSSILKMPKLTIPLTKPDDIIVFEDALVEEMCLAAFDTNEDDELS